MQQLSPFYGRVKREAKYIVTNTGSSVSKSELKSKTG